MKEKEILQIGGMTCAACAARIEKGLSRLEGVHDVHVNLALERGTVYYNPTIVSSDHIIKKIEALGYQAERYQEEKEIGTDSSLLRNRFITSAIFSIPLICSMFTHFLGEGGIPDVFVASLELSSQHPVAKAIVRSAKEKRIPLLQVASSRTVPGFGIIGSVNGKSVSAGTYRLMNQTGIDLSPVRITMEKMEEEAMTLVFVAIDGRLAGILAIDDQVKESSVEAIVRLRALGIKTVLITGDHRKAADKIGRMVGVDQVESELLPHEKAEIIKRYQQQGYRVAMVGDGINDAPALATADLGIAIGTGTDVAMEAADITLMRGDLRSIADTIDLSRVTMRNIRQNLFWALFYNIIGIPVAALGLLAPWIAGAAMAFSSVSVVSNALRLKRVKIYDHPSHR